VPAFLVAAAVLLIFTCTVNTYQVITSMNAVSAGVALADPSLLIPNYIYLLVLIATSLIAIPLARAFPRVMAILACTTQGLAYHVSAVTSFMLWWAFFDLAQHRRARIVTDAIWIGGVGLVVGGVIVGTGMWLQFRSQSVGMMFWQHRTVSGKQSYSPLTIWPWQKSWWQRLPRTEVGEDGSGDRT